MTRELRARFNPDPVAEVRSISISSPASSTSSLAPSPGPSTPPPVPDMAFSPVNSSSLSPYPIPVHPRLYMPSPTPPAFPYMPPPTPLTPDVDFRPALSSPPTMTPREAKFLRPDMDRRGGTFNQIKRVLFWQKPRRSKLVKTKPMARGKAKPRGPTSTGEKTFRGISMFNVC